MLTKQQKEIFKLAGKLATVCHEILNSDVKTVSDNIKIMEQILIEYDNAVFNELDERKLKEMGY